MSSLNILPLTVNPQEDRMKEWKTVHSIEDLIPHYDGFLIDLWGVVHDGATPYPGIVQALNTLINAKKNIIFVSNAARPSATLINKLQTFGIALTPEMILSSADVIRYQITHREDPAFKALGPTLFHLGSDRNKDILAELQIQVQETDMLEKADYILLSAYIDENEDLNQYQDRLKQALSLNLPMVCANPDKLIKEAGKLRYCSGFIAEHYETLGGKVLYYGKPHKPIFEFALRRLREHGITPLEKVVMIGDTLETDIAGAQAIGIASALTLTGNMGMLLAKQPNLETIFQAYKLSPDWVISNPGA